MFVHKWLMTERKKKKFHFEMKRWFPLTFLLLTLIVKFQEVSRLTNISMGVREKENKTDVRSEIIRYKRKLLKAIKQLLKHWIFAL